MFRLIVGEEKSSGGSVLLNGLLQRGLSRDIGYCPQSNCIHTYLTVEDYFFLFGRIRSVRSEILSSVVEDLLDLFLLQFFRRHFLRQLSGGTIRRLHAALAFLGSPTLILLGQSSSSSSSSPLLTFLFSVDEPTTGPSSSRGKFSLVVVVVVVRSGSFQSSSNARDLPSCSFVSVDITLDFSFDGRM